MLIGLVVIAGVLAVTLVPLMILRGFGRDLKVVEDDLHDPSVRTVSYAVPPGRDPAELMAVVARAGYRAIEEHPGLLLIACPGPDDPDKVRRLLDVA